MAIDPIKNAIAWTGLNSAGRDYLVTGGYSALRVDPYEGAFAARPTFPPVAPGTFGNATDIAMPPVLGLNYSQPVPSITLSGAPAFDRTADSEGEGFFDTLFGGDSTVFGDSLFSDSGSNAFVPAQPGFIRSVFGE